MGVPAAAAAATTAAEGVVVESGPVVYDDVAADEEEEDEDEPCVSAMDLFGSNGEFKHSLWAVDGSSSLRAEWVDDLNFLNVVDTDSIAVSDCETVQVSVLMNVSVRVTAQTPGMF